MTLIISKNPFNVEDPIIRIEAKAKTKREEEGLVALTFLGKHSPDVSPDAPPNAEVLEALGYAVELAVRAYTVYKDKFAEYTMRQAMMKRVPQADGDHGPDDVDPLKDNILPFNKKN